MSMRTRVVTVTAALAFGLGAVAALPALPAAAKSISSANLKTLENNLSHSKHLTYQATYTTVNGTQKQTVTIAQAPPKSNFSAGNGSVINTGSKTYYCSTNSSGSSSGQQCLSVSGSNPLLGLENIFSPAVALGAFTEAKEGLVSHLLGIKVSSSSATFAGQPSTCLSVIVHGKTGKYCVTKQGLLSYSGTGPTQNFQLTKYSSKPSSSLFVLPAGATTVTLPGGVTIPSIP